MNPSSSGRFSSRIKGSPRITVNSVDIDRAKADLYAAAGVLVYWMLMAEAAAAEVYTESSFAGDTIFRDSGLATSCAVDDASNRVFSSPQRPPQRQQHVSQRRIGQANDRQYFQGIRGICIATIVEPQ